VKRLALVALLALGAWGCLGTALIAVGARLEAGRCSTPDPSSSSSGRFACEHNPDAGADFWRMYEAPDGGYIPPP
jgi:hypothetical protein